MIGPSVIEEANSHLFLPYRPDNCFSCGKYVDNGERPWAWVGRGSTIIMHQDCFLDWFPRVQKDDVKIRQLFTAKE